MRRDVTKTDRRRPGKIFHGTTLLLAFFAAGSVRAGAPAVTFEPAEDTARTAKEAAEESKAVPPPVAPEVKARSRAFTVYKPPAPVAAAADAEVAPAAVESGDAGAEPASTDPVAPAAPSGVSGTPVGTLTGPVVSTVLQGEHSAQAVRDTLPQLPKIKINGLGNGTIKLGH